MGGETSKARMCVAATVESGNQYHGAERGARDGSMIGLLLFSLILFCMLHAASHGTDYSYAAM